MSKAPPPDQPTKTIRERSAERSAAALRDNLKRRKSQARGRAGMAIVTPDDDARAQDNAGTGTHRRDGDR